MPPVSAEKPSKKILPAESAPALPSTPVQEPPTDPFLKTITPKNLALADSAITNSQSVRKRRKFVKTLRLTSDQLVSLQVFAKGSKPEHYLEIVRAEAWAELDHFLLVFYGRCCVHGEDIRLGLYRSNRRF